jgi:heme exporter protein D
MSKFFYMGGYAFYVWGSYLVALILIVGEIIILHRRKKALLGKSKQDKHWDTREVASETSS